MAQKDRWKGEQALVVLQLRLKQFHLWPSVIKIKPLRRTPKAQPAVIQGIAFFLLLFISAVNKVTRYWAFWMLELKLESLYSGSPVSFSKVALPIAIAIAVAVFRLLHVMYLIFAITTFPVPFSHPFIQIWPPIHYPSACSRC
jgi:hypothetical protein